MENIVPVPLRRLRAADIIRMAGLADAALGQEYSRTAYIHETQRLGACLRGSVDIAPTATHTVLPSDEVQFSLSRETEKTYAYSVEITVHSANSWESSCSCHASTASSICLHAAALLYLWLAKPDVFEVLAVSETTVPPASLSSEQVPALVQANVEVAPASRSTVKEATASPATIRYSTDLLNNLSQLGLSELRNIAREYRLTLNGMSRQQIAEAIFASLQQTNVVRQMASELEKTQRQLLAALILAGGSLSDNDLRGMVERFSLGRSGQLQHMLLALQGKAFLFRTSMHGTDTSVRTGLGSTLLDIHWYVPVEVRIALHVSAPVTYFDVEQPDEKYGPVQLKYANQSALFPNLLLVARALAQEELNAGEGLFAAETTTPGVPEINMVGRIAGGTQAASTVLLPVPADTPSPQLLASLQRRLGLEAAYCRFATHILRTADIVQSVSGDNKRVQVIPDIAQLLLGDMHGEVLRDLFQLWVKRSSYHELSDLLEHGVRICCRVTSAGMPLLRPGELKAEMSEARQTLLTLLAQSPRGKWIHFQAFAKFIWRLNPLFLQQRQRLFAAPHWWFEQEDRRPFKPLQWNDWRRGELLYLTRFMSGPLYWWGICDLALSSQGQLLAFRLNPLAESLLSAMQDGGGEGEHNAENALLASSSVASQTADEKQPLQVMTGNDGQILVACSLEAWSLIELCEIFAEPIGVEHHFLRYRFTARTIAKALGRGQRPERLFAILRALVELRDEQSEALQQLLTQLENWLAGYGRVRIYTGVTLLETIEPVVMRELSAITTVEEQIMRTFQPTLHVLRPGTTGKVLEELRRRGHAPLVHTEDSYGAE
ncbi:MAG TPA: hypothetical protein VL461_07400 [Dictyobacter sp.]|jgi:hypothetical protein|nr:hypothetical protein [Dictyobacter sp.]